MNPPERVGRPRSRRRHVCLVIASSVLAVSCSSSVASPQTDRQLDAATSAPAAASSVVTTTTATPPESTTAAPTTTAVPTTSTTTSVAPTTTSSTTSTTSIPPGPDVFDPNCVVRTEATTTFEQIATEHEIEDPVALWFVNGQVDTLTAGDLVDVCPANALNDIDGEPAPDLDDVSIRAAVSSNVERQQSKMNELFSGYGIDPLEVDGVSGPRTGQRLCATRLALGLDTTIADMAPGSLEQATLFATDALPTPDSTATESQRWVLIDRTCQIMFIGAGNDTAFIFPTSTGSEGFETRDQDRAEAFRFNPAIDNGGWHDSSEFPVGVDNPLNGNLYKPLYFDLGQAIHGANNVPAVPASKGCARLSVDHQNTFVSWLGLDDATGETWRKGEMNVTVSVQGEFIPRT